MLWACVGMQIYVHNNVPFKKANLNITLMSGMRSLTKSLARFISILVKKMTVHTPEAASAFSQKI